MIVFNSTKSSKICNAEKAESFFSRALGLMFRKRIGREEGLLIRFPPRTSCSIHSFFMRFPIDLIFIDDRMRVVDLTTLERWRVYKPVKRCRWVLEVNRGIIKEKNVEIGDVLEFRST